MLTVLDTDVVTIRTETPATRFAGIVPAPATKSWRNADELPSLPDLLDAPLEELGDETAGPLADLSADLPADLPDQGLDAGRTSGRRGGLTCQPHAGATGQVAAAPAYLRLVQSVWFARLLWACAVLPLVTLIGIYVGQRPTADELFRSADAMFRQEDFARSIEGFGQFLHRHPRHALANEARMKRDLAQLLDRFDHGMDAALLVSEIKAVTGRWNDDEQHHPDAQRSLSQMLPALVQDLTRVARTAAQRGGSQTASDARAAAADGLHMMYEYLPPRTAAFLQRRPIAGCARRDRWRSRWWRPLGNWTRSSHLANRRQQVPPLVGCPSRRRWVGLRRSGGRRGPSSSLPDVARREARCLRSRPCRAGDSPACPSCEPPIDRHTVRATGCGCRWSHRAPAR